MIATTELVVDSDNGEHSAAVAQSASRNEQERSSGNRILAGCLIYGTAIVATVIICGSVWPGFLSWDPLDTLRQAREGVDTNWFPPMVVYVQRVFDAIYPGAGLLFVFQVGMFLLSLADILFVSSVSLPLALAAIVFIAFTPALLGPMLVVWKDIAMMTFFTLGFAAYSRGQQRKRRGLAHSQTWFYVSLMAIVFATFLRHNGFPPALPLIWLNCKQFTSGKKVMTVMAGWLALMIGVNFFLNTYRLPDLKRIPQGRIQSIVQAFDLVGISVISKQLVVPPRSYAQYPGFTVDELRREYWPMNMDMSFAKLWPHQRPLDKKLIARIPEHEMTDIWIRNIVEHPIAYARHRWYVFKALLGIGMERPYVFTYDRIGENKFGIRFHPNFATPWMLAYIMRMSLTILEFPWFYYAIGLVLYTVLQLRGQTQSVESRALLASAFLLTLPMFVIGCAADLRYHAWAIAAICLAFFLSLSQLMRRSGRAMETIRQS